MYEALHAESVLQLLLRRKSDTRILLLLIEECAGLKQKNAAQIHVETHGLRGTFFFILLNQRRSADILLHRCEFQICRTDRFWLQE